MSTLGENIVAIRKSKGITQKALAEAVSVSATRLNYWEKGRNNPPIEYLDKVAKALNVPVDALMPSASEEQIKQWDEKFNPDGKLAESVRTLEQIEKEYGKEAVMLLEAFSQLNAVGMVKAMEYVSDLSEQDKYKK